MLAYLFTLQSLINIPFKTFHLFNPTVTIFFGASEKVKFSNTRWVSHRRTTQEPAKKPRTIAKVVGELNARVSTNLALFIALPDLLQFRSSFNLLRYLPLQLSLSNK